MVFGRSKKKEQREQSGDEKRSSRRRDRSAPPARGASSRSFDGRKGRSCDPGKRHGGGASLHIESGNGQTLCLNNAPHCQCAYHHHTYAATCQQYHYPYAHTVQHTYPVQTATTAYMPVTTTQYVGAPIATTTTTMPLAPVAAVPMAAPAPMQYPTQGRLHNVGGIPVVIPVNRR